MGSLNESTEKLWKVYIRNHNSQKTKEKLILNYLPLVKYIAGRVAIRLPSHIDINDLISSGVIGLINAIEHYDPKFKTKFETYAIIRIRGAIIDELRSLDWVPRSMREKFCAVQKAHVELEQKFGRPATETEVAEHLSISFEDLNEILNDERYVSFLSLDEIINLKENGNKAISVINSVPDTKQASPLDNAEFNEQKELLAETIKRLPEQEKLVIILYYYEGLMLKEIGQVLNISESRVSQIHTKALLRLGGKLKKLMSHSRILNQFSLKT